MNTSKRFAEKTQDPEVVFYKMKQWAEYDEKMKPLIEKCRSIVDRIQQWSLRLPGSWWARITEISDDDKSSLRSIKEEFQAAHEQGGRGGKNILNASNKEDRTVWFGQDNRVFGFKNFSKVIYKESSQPAGPEELLYLRRKYNILKTYLGKLIPQTRFVLGEVNHEKRVTKWMANVDIPQMSIITIQRKIEGDNLQKMNREKKKNPTLLSALEKGHKKYILLKMFVRQISEELWLSADTIDVKMDLGPLSDMDRFDTQDPISIRKNLTSPNIMFDGKGVYFVDLDFGVWTPERQQVYEVLMQPETIQRWDEVMGNFGLL